MDDYYKPDLKEWHGKPNPCLYNPRATVGSILYHGMLNHRDRVAQIFAEDGSRVTRAELLLTSCRVARNLQRLGIGSGDNVCILSLNNKYVDSLMIGCIFILAPFIHLDLENGTEKLVEDFCFLRPNLIVCEAFKEKEVIEALQALQTECQVLTFELFNCQLATPITGDSTFQPVSCIPDTEAQALFYSHTSGTTDSSKRASVSHAIITSQCIGVMKTFSPHDVVLNFKPYTWITTVFSLIHYTVLGPARVIVNQPFTPELQAELIKTYGVTIVASTALETAKFIEFGKFDLRSVRSFGCTGVRLPVRIRETLERHLVNGYASNVYGMTETCFLAINTDKARPNTVGRPLDRLKFKICTPDGDRLGPNCVGEICVKLPYPFLGYVSSPNETTHIHDTDGWIHTGDLGYFDTHSFLHIEGRFKGILRIKDTKAAHFKDTNSYEIEDFITQSTGLYEVCVIGIEDPDLPYDLPAAAIVKPPSCSITATEIETLVTQKYTSHYISGGVHFLDALPITRSMKFKRYEVKKILEEKYFGAARAKATSNVGQKEKRG